MRSWIFENSGLKVISLVLGLALWYIVAGQGRMWRRAEAGDDGAREEIVELAAGTSISIPNGTRFQFRCDSDEPLSAVGVTMPPWPGENEAVLVDGVWDAAS